MADLAYDPHGEQLKAIRESIERVEGLMRGMLAIQLIRDGHVDHWTDAIKLAADSAKVEELYSI